MSKSKSGSPTKKSQNQNGELKFLQ